MHRVELKVRAGRREGGEGLVPNAPCGVESVVFYLYSDMIYKVPNAPCGVESIL